VNFFTDQVARFGADPEIIVERDEWEDVLGILMMKAGAPNPQAYSTRRTFSDERMTTAMSRRGFKFGAKRPDTRDPPPERVGMPENPKNRSNKVLRCFACNSRWHLSFHCPHATPTQRSFFGHILNVATSYFGEVIPLYFLTEDNCSAMSSGNLAHIADNVLAGDDSCNVVVLYTIDSVHPTTSSGPSPIVLDTGAPLTCSGMSSLKQDCAAYGFDYDAMMSTMPPSSKSLAIIIASSFVGSFTVCAYTSAMFCVGLRMDWPILSSLRVAVLTLYRL
jgi:hypothetical protein